MTETRFALVEPTRLGTWQCEQLNTIYLDSFPPYERADFLFLLQSIRAGERWLFTALQNDNVLGLAILVPFIARGIHLLEYLAVARDARGHGIGGRLLEHVVDVARATRTVRGIVIEVEHDEEGDATERVVRQRRIAFYARHGACVVDAAPQYRAPLADRVGVMRIKLLWLPIATDATAPRGDELRECITGIFTKSYGLDVNDRLLHNVLAGILE
ncbi:MAG: GNAT family N-acetyltransferase [Anaerolineae bacterium]|nr:GNAT family N-acetyltransferase [Anaerolineae bacterium]